MPLPKVDDFAENVVAEQISQITGVSQVQSVVSSGPPFAFRSIPPN